MFTFFSVALCVFMTFPGTLQLSYIILVKNVDKSVSPQQYLSTYLDKYSDVASADVHQVKILNAFYIKESVFLVIETLHGLNLNPIRDDTFSVEENVAVRLVDKQSQSNYCESSNVTKDLWHIGRIRTKNKIELGFGEHVFESNSTEADEGSGADIYILDTGVRKSHRSFGGRVTWGYVATNAWNVDKTEDDLNGHGTHVAGIVGADTYGIARSAAIISVKVLDRGGGSVLSDLLEGIAFAMNHASKKSNETGAGVKAICNLSLGFAGSSSLLENLIINGTEMGLIFVAAAGNDDASSCVFSPGNIDETITVAASDINDVFYDNSNFGPCVDIIAPGVDILSAGISSDTSDDLMTGTSMAAPMVAGALAIYLSRYPGDNITLPMVMDWLESTATKDAIDIPPNIAVTTVNHLIFITCITEEEELTSPSSNPTTTTPGGDLEPWEIALITIAVIVVVTIPVVIFFVIKHAKKASKIT